MTIPPQVTEATGATRGVMQKVTTGEGHCKTKPSVAQTQIVGDAAVELAVSNEKAKKQKKEQTSDQCRSNNVRAVMAIPTERGTSGTAMLKSMQMQPRR